MQKETAYVLPRQTGLDRQAHCDLMKAIKDFEQMIAT
jgi:hypothetical protein